MSYTKKGYIEKQIEAIGKTVVAILFGKERLGKIFEVEQEKEQDSSTDMEDEILDRIVKKHFDDANYKDAESMILNSLKQKSTIKKLVIALNFYNNLYNMDDEKLAKYGFSRSDIEKSVTSLNTYWNL